MLDNRCQNWVKSRSCLFPALPMKRTFIALFAFAALVAAPAVQAEDPGTEWPSWIGSLESTAFDPFQLPEVPVSAPAVRLPVITFPAARQTTETVVIRTSTGLSRMFANQVFTPALPPAATGGGPVSVEGEWPDWIGVPYWWE